MAGGETSLDNEVGVRVGGGAAKNGGHFAGQFRRAVVQYAILLKKVDEFVRKGSGNG